MRNRSVDGFSMANSPKETMSDRGTAALAGVCRVRPESTHCRGRRASHPLTAPSAIDGRVDSGPSVWREGADRFKLPPPVGRRPSTTPPRAGGLHGAALTTKSLQGPTFPASDHAAPSTASAP